MTYIDERRRQRSVAWSKERNQKDQAGNQKNTDPTIDQKLPMEAMINPSAERIKKSSR